MALIYQERILDLGTHGLVTLTQDLGGYLPIPAQKFGHARWHAPDGKVHERLALCTRRSSAAALDEAARALRARLTGAVPAVQARVDWVAAQADDDYLEAPGQAAALDGGLLLLIFGRLAGPHIIRIVDLVANRVLGEETADALCARLEVKRLLVGQAYEAVLHGSGGSWVGLWLGAGLELLCWRDGRLQRAAPRPVLDSLGRFALTPQAWFVHPYESREIRVFEATVAASAPKLVNSTHLCAGSLFLHGALQADRCVVDHGGGVVEVLDGQGRSVIALRPFPALARKDNAGVGTPAADGRHVLCGGGGKLALDLAQARQAEPPAPPPLPDYERLVFKPEVLYRADQQATASGLATLHRGELQVLPWECLDWAAALSATSRRSRTARATAADNSAWADLQRPGFRLLVAPGGAGLCQLYGLPHLPRGERWPLHEGRAMMHLCQIDLAALAALGITTPLPTRGGLLVFVATDNEGQVAINELFNPVAVRVICLEQLAAKPAPAPVGAAPRPARQPLKPVAGSAVWPQPNAALVQALGWAPQAIDAYRQHLDRRMPEGAGNGHLLLGYPGLLQSNDLDIDAAAEHDLPGGPTAWRLLLQLDSDETLMWGTDSGRLYLMVHESDLAAGDFSRVVALTQGL